MDIAKAFQTRTDRSKQPQAMLRRTLGLPLTEGDLRALFKRLDKVKTLLFLVWHVSVPENLWGGKIVDHSFWSEMTLIPLVSRRSLPWHVGKGRRRHARLRGASCTRIEKRTASQRQQAAVQDKGKGPRAVFWRSLPFALICLTFREKLASLRRERSAARVVNCLMQC